MNVDGAKGFELVGPQKGQTELTADLDGNNNRRFPRTLAGRGKLLWTRDEGVQ